VHPRAEGRRSEEVDHSLGLDVANDSAPRYLRWVAEQADPHLGRSVLEVGSGIGAITQYLAEGRTLVATDISEECIAALHERFDDASNVDVIQADLRTWSTDRQFDSVVLINVLEHIEDDAGALRSLSRFLRPGGSVVVYVPALNGLFGNWDRKVGHYRRYSRWRLRNVLRAAGLEPVETRYSNTLAIPAWMLFSRFSKAKPSTADRGLPAWDRIVVPISRFIESRVRMPLGLNLLGVGRYEGGAAKSGRTPEGF
jgi:SAM-dependent methyltransferase